jgi:hypothetical protein
MTAEERVRLFLDAMNQWERRVFPEFVKANDAQMNRWTEELRAIFAAHLSKKGKGPRQWGKKIHPTKDVPTNVSDRQYDQQIVRVDPGPTKSSLFVITQSRQDAHTAYRFKVIVDKAGVPWVDEQRWCVVVDGKLTEDWQPGLH